MSKFKPGGGARETIKVNKKARLARVKKSRKVVKELHKLAKQQAKELDHE